MTPTAVYTKWGWVSGKALFRFKEAHGRAVELQQPSFELDGHPWDTRFVGYLIEFCESEGLAAERTDQPVTLFEQAQGEA